MIRISRAAAGLAALAAASLLAGCSTPTHADLRRDDLLLDGPAIRTVESPYRGALMCLRSQLTPEQKESSFAVLDFPDKTGKISIGQGGDGALSTQGGVDRVMTALHAIGVRVVEIDLAFRGYLQWVLALGNDGLLGNDNVYNMHQQDGTTTQSRIMPVLKGSVAPADYVIRGSIDSASSIPGGGIEANVFGIGGGVRTYRMLVSMDGRVIKMPVNGQRLGGTIVATDPLQKQMVAYEMKAGVASFFNGPAYTEINIGQDGREAIQFAELTMLDRLAFDLVSGTFGIRSCDEQLAYAERRTVPSKESGAAKR